MKTLVIAACLTVAVGLSQASADVGKTYLTAYDKAKGVQAKAGKYGKQILLRTSARKTAVKAKPGTKGSKTAASEPSVTYCGKTYYTTKRGKNWIAAHESAKHTLVVRRHTAKGKYTVLCGEMPKRVVAKKPAKKPPVKTN